MIVLYIMSNGSPEQNLNQIFKLLDIDNDGEVSISEFKKVITDLHNIVAINNNLDASIQDLLVEKAFIEMDINDDGKVTKEEFVGACLANKRFSRMLTLKLINIFVE